MILRAVKSYLTPAFPHGKEVDWRTTTKTYPRNANRAPSVHKSSHAKIIKSPSPNPKHYIPIIRVVGPTAAAVALRLSYPLRRPSSLKNRKLLDGREWTNTLIAANVLVHVARRVSGGKFLHWGAKTNDLVGKRLLWRLVTSSFLHANIGHLMASCYSLNSLGPEVEYICGTPERYLAVYITSAVAGSATSYLLCKAATVGASGAIFGLMGSYATFIVRNQNRIEESEYYLRSITRKIVINLVAGLLSTSSDNWRRVGGLIGGGAYSWFVGPAWEFDSRSRRRKRRSNGQRSNVLPDQEASDLYIPSKDE